MTLVSQSTPKANRPHQCQHCRHIIPKGVRYLRQFCKDGGDVWDFISHEDCHAAALHLFDMDGGYDDDGITPLIEYENNTGVFPDYIRGLFPHVICRLEFRKQRRGEAQ